MKKKTYYYNIAYLYNKNQKGEAVANVSCNASCITKAKKEFERKHSIIVVRIRRDKTFEK